MLYFCLLYDHFAFICYVSLAEKKQLHIDGANMLGPLILPGSVLLSNTLREPASQAGVPWKIFSNLNITYAIERDTE